MSPLCCKYRLNECYATKPVCTAHRKMCQKVEFKLNVTRAYSMKQKHSPSNWMRIFNMIFNSTLRYSKLQYVICYDSVCIVHRCRDFYCVMWFWNGFINNTLSAFSLQSKVFSANVCSSIFQKSFYVWIEFLIASKLKSKNP